jgi:hypothetical protein
LAFSRGLAEKQIANTDIFVQVRPMNSFSSADEAPAAALLSHTVQKPRIPSQRNGNRPAIGKLHRQSVLGDNDVLHPGFPDFSR